MRSLAQKQDRRDTGPAVLGRRSSWTRLGLAHRLESELNLPQTIGNKTPQEFAWPDGQHSQIESAGTKSPCLHHDFKDISILPPTPVETPIRINPAHGPVLQRDPVTQKRTFTPTVFSDAKSLVAKIASDNPKEEDLAGACRYLDDLPVAKAMSLAQQIGARQPTAVTALESKAMQGWATTRLRVVLAAVRLKGQISRVGFAAEHASDLQTISALEGQQVLDVLGPKVAELETIQKSKGFQALRADEQARLSYLIGGSTTLSEQAPAQMRALLSKPQTSKDDPATFRKFLTDEKYLRWDVGPTHGATRPRHKFTLGSAVDVANHVFGGVNALAADALRYDVVFDTKDASGTDIKQTIVVFVPKSAGLKDKRYRRPTINEVAETLASTPDISLSKIVTVDVHWMTYTGGTGKPDDTKETSAAAGAAGNLNIYPTIAFGQNPAGLASDVLHETGHTTSLAAWGDAETDSAWDKWRAAMKSDGMAVSQYGKTSIDEDFAESWALYAPVVGTPRENEVRALIPERCKLMDTLLWQKPRKGS
jgi:hypothetical protein